MDGEIKKRIKVTLNKRKPNSSEPVSFEFNMYFSPSKSDNGITVEHAINCNPVNADPNIIKVLQESGINLNEVMSIEVKDDSIDKTPNYY